MKIAIPSGNCHDKRTINISVIQDKNPGNISKALFIYKNGRKLKVKCQKQKNRRSVMRGDCYETGFIFVCGKSMTRACRFPDFDRWIEYYALVVKNLAEKNLQAVPALR